MKLIPFKMSVDPADQQKLFPNSQLENYNSTREQRQSLSAHQDSIQGLSKDPVRANRRSDFKSQDFASLDLESANDSQRIFLRAQNESASVTEAFFAAVNLTEHFFGDRETVKELNATEQRDEDWLPENMMVQDYGLQETGGNYSTRNLYPTTVSDFILKNSNAAKIMNNDRNTIVKEKSKKKHKTRKKVRLEDLTNSDDNHSQKEDSAYSETNPKQKVPVTLNFDKKDSSRTVFSNSIENFSKTGEPFKFFLNGSQRSSVHPPITLTNSYFDSGWPQGEGIPRDRFPEIISINRKGSANASSGWIAEDSTVPDAQKLRAEEVTIIVLVMLLWLGAISLFINR